MIALARYGDGGNMTSITLDISVIICAYTEDRWDDLVASVESIQRQQAQPREIIVVVDYNPALLERVRLSLSNVILIENREARGLSGARNSGVMVAQGGVIAFLDDDAVAAPDWLETLYSGYANANVIGVGGAIEPLWPEKRPAWFPNEFDWVVGCVYRGMPEEPSRVRNFIGANMSFRREVFENVGNFRLGKVGDRPRPEETELCIRAHQLWPESILLYEPRARVAHTVPVRRTYWRYFLTRCYNEGLGKAAMVHFVGTNDGLSAEWKYTLNTLPQGIVRGAADVFLRSDLAGFARAGAIIVGLLVASGGYLAGVVLLFLNDNQANKNPANPI